MYKLIFQKVGNIPLLCHITTISNVLILKNTEIYEHANFIPIYKERKKEKVGNRTCIFANFPTFKIPMLHKALGHFIWEPS